MRCVQQRMYWVASEAGLDLNRIYFAYGCACRIKFISDEKVA